VTEATWEQSAIEAGSEKQSNSWPSCDGGGERKGRGGGAEQNRAERAGKEMLTEVSQIAFRERLSAKSGCARD